MDKSSLRAVQGSRVCTKKISQLKSPSYERCFPRLATSGETETLSPTAVDPATALTERSFISMGVHKQRELG